VLPLVLLLFMGVLLSVQLQLQQCCWVWGDALLMRRVNGLIGAGVELRWLVSCMLSLLTGVIHCRAGSRMPLLGDRRRGKTRWMRGLRVMMQAQAMAALISTVVQ
jgi:hypothetical protein